MNNQFVSGTLDSRKDFDSTPKGQYDFWSEELNSSLRARKDWHKAADKIVSRYLDTRKGTGMETSDRVPFRLNLFPS